MCGLTISSPSSFFLQTEDGQECKYELNVKMAVCLHLHTCKPVRSFFLLQDILHLAMGAYVLYGASMHTWTCRRCDKPASLWCGGCKTVNYCSSECQRASWKEHKPVCYAVSNALRERGTFQVFLCNFFILFRSQWIFGTWCGRACFRREWNAY